MIRIKSVIPKEAYRLEVQLENGSSVILDFSSRLHTVRFGMLADKDFFRRAVTDGDFVRWDNKIEISVSEVFQLAQKENSRSLTVGEHAVTKQLKEVEEDENEKKNERTFCRYGYISGCDGFRRRHCLAEGEFAGGRKI